MHFNELLIMLTFFVLHFLDHFMLQLRHHSCIFIAWDQEQPVKQVDFKMKIERVSCCWSLCNLLVIHARI